MKQQSIAGMSLKGGRKDNFFFCHLEYFEEGNRCFLKSLLQVKDESFSDGSDAIKAWIENYSLSELVVDFPLTQAACSRCSLECPGIARCKEPTTETVTLIIDEILKIDAKEINERPKGYEQDRNKDDEVNHSRDVLSEKNNDYMLSRSFKRRLKKGYLPYWNRPIDVWIWMDYYDQLLSLFNVSYDSFGNSSLMVHSRFAYLRKHFPDNFGLYEGNLYLTLIELLRYKIIKRVDALNFSHFEIGVESRRNIVREIEKNLNIFIYEHDFELLVKNIRAFESFLLGVCGLAKHLNHLRKIPVWATSDQTLLLVPTF